MPSIEPLRTCRICGKTACSIQELELFSKDSHYNYGRENRCKRCNADRVVLQNRQNPKPSYERTKAFRAKHPESHRKDIAKDKQKHPDRYRARKMVYNRQIPLAPSCVQCGSGENLERHHPNYSKPLEIITLCRKCHGLAHRTVLLCKVGA
jgi:hypothetical protein